MAEVEGGNTAPRSVDDIQLVPSLVAVRRRPHKYFGHQNVGADVQHDFGDDVTPAGRGDREQRVGPLSSYGWPAATGHAE